MSSPSWRRSDARLSAKGAASRHRRASPEGPDGSCADFSTSRVVVLCHWAPRSPFPAQAHRPPGTLTSPEHFVFLQEEIRLLHRKCLSSVTRRGRGPQQAPRSQRRLAGGVSRRSRHGVAVRSHHAGHGDTPHLTVPMARDVCVHLPFAEEAGGHADLLVGERHLSRSGSLPPVPACQPPRVPHTCPAGPASQPPQPPPRHRAPAAAPLGRWAGRWAETCILIRPVARLLPQAVRNNPWNNPNPAHQQHLAVSPQVPAVSTEPRKHLPSPPNLRVPAQGLTALKVPLGGM